MHIDRSRDQQCVVPTKSANESAVRLLLDDGEKESLTASTEIFPAYEPLEDDKDQREAVIVGDDEYVDEDAHVHTCESHESLV
jgi:hypothetical protein